MEKGNEQTTTWIRMGSDFSVDNVRTALSSFSRNISSSHKKLFEGIFTTLETGLSKLGADTKSQTNAVRDLIQLINEIPMHEVSLLMSEFIAEHLKGRDTMKIYDPTSGFRVIIMTVANSSVKSKVLKLLPKLKNEETGSLCVA